MVRLRLYKENGYYYQWGEFQFQHGAIKVANAPQLKDDFEDFNSNMVRLR